MGHWQLQMITGLHCKTVLLFITAMPILILAQEVYLQFRQLPGLRIIATNAGNVINIANANTSANTVYLNGNLTLDASNLGTVNIGNIANAQHNDIEYSSGGASYY